VDTSSDQTLTPPAQRSTMRSQGDEARESSLTVADSEHSERGAREILEDPGEHLMLILVFGLLVTLGVFALILAFG
jgi:hypothetical protein